MHGEIGVLLARHRPNEATEAKPGLECVGADERCAKQDQEAVEEAVVLDEITRHDRIWHRSGEQLLDEAVPHSMRPTRLLAARRASVKRSGIVRFLPMDRAT